MTLNTLLTADASLIRPIRLSWRDPSPSTKHKFTTFRKISRPNDTGLITLVQNFKHFRSSLLKMIGRRARANRHHPAPRSKFCDELVQKSWKSNYGVLFCRLIRSEKGIAKNERN